MKNAKKTIVAAAAIEPLAQVLRLAAVVVFAGWMAAAVAVSAPARGGATVVSAR